MAISLPADAEQSLLVENLRLLEDALDHLPLFVRGGEVRLHVILHGQDVERFTVAQQAILEGVA